MREALGNGDIDTLFMATVEATEEAVIDSMLMAGTMTGRDGNTAMALPVGGGDLVDPFGGQADLKAGLIRAVGDPLDRFAEDGLRPLRACRSATTNMTWWSPRANR